MKTTLWAGAGALAALIAVVGCGAGSGGRACTDIGAASEVSVRIEIVPGTVYRLCAGSTCATRAATEDSDNAAFVSVTLPDPVGAGTIPVRLTATARGADRPSVDERATATLHRFEPNGHGCGPVVYQGQLSYSPATGLVADR
ncbi:hypothetical protein GA0115240_13836 [Streptomyces sp. DvalAA-14]|nr:hypothetical protein GA0115240_13836 [Streptomyces sp. DvalAA-14]